MPPTLIRADTLLDGTGAPAIRGGAARVPERRDVMVLSRSRCRDKAMSASVGDKKATVMLSSGAPGGAQARRVTG